MRTTFKALALFAAALTVAASNAGAVTIDATITADNHYGLYVGGANGTPMTFIGQNESGAGGAPGEFNWSIPESYQFNADPDLYIYIVGWSDDLVAQGVLAQFIVNGTTIATGTNGWEYALGPDDLDDGDPAPSAAVLSTFVSGAAWSSVVNSLPNGSDPWGTIAGISTAASWIWGGPLIGGGTGGPEYQVFRTRIPREEVPESATVFLLLAGLTAVALTRTLSPLRARAPLS